MSKKAALRCFSIELIGRPDTYRSSRSSVGMPWVTLRVTNPRRTAGSRLDAERPEMHASAEHWHDSHAHAQIT
ncbi:hypothetical protein ALP05_05089 [Pseudomonas caricapapayae]|uniref:Uncharacterized protein n=1 Tax=Pseudomonas caricapapayae TaxID=46678 RepID=A0A3M6F281_9PSED|nr:hypothetical protein ALP05_05089 [Pseudomonas caricapapayae]